MKQTLKPCKDYQYRDPITNRCRNKSPNKKSKSKVKSKSKSEVKLKSPNKKSKSKVKSKIKSKSEVKSSKTLVPCKDYQYRDPVTNRCRNKSKSPNKQSKTKTKSKSSKTLIPCKDYQYRDPITNRCRNKSKSPNKKSKSPNKDNTLSKCITRSKVSLTQNQIRVVKYMEKNDTLLVVHGTGLGKTLTAITVSQCYLDNYPNKKIYFIGPASLIANFKKEMVKYGVKNEKKYNYFSYEKILSLYNSNNLPKIKNNLLIIDEVHNLRTHDSQKSKIITKLSFNADKLLLLTATPYVNNLQDFIPIINMLYQKNIIGTYSNYTKGQVEIFLNKMIDSDNLMKLKKLLHNKIDVVMIDKKDENFPSKIEHYISVPMTSQYYKIYKNAVNYIDDKDTSFSPEIKFNNPSVFFNAYRKAVNYCGDEYLSMKIEYALPIIKNGKTIIYTNWIQFGIDAIINVIKNDSSIKYESFTGNVPIMKRKTIIEDFNNDLFNCLIITKAGGEGLDLKGVKNVIILDPPWNDSSLKQIIGRAIRYKSHIHLPEKERIVNIYYMVLTIPTNISNTLNISSGDELLYAIIERKSTENTLLLEILKELSIK